MIICDAITRCSKFYIKNIYLLVFSFFSHFLIESDKQIDVINLLNKHVELVLNYIV